MGSSQSSEPRNISQETAPTLGGHSQNPQSGSDEHQSNEGAADSTNDLSEFLPSIPSSASDLEQVYQTGDFQPYTQGFESFKTYCFNHEEDINVASAIFKAEKHANKRTIDLQICYASKQDFEDFIVPENGGAVVRVPADIDRAPMVQLMASHLSDNFDIQNSFRVRGYSGRKVVDMPLVITEDDIVEGISPLLNSTLALSAKCDCGVSRPAPPDIDPESNIAGAILLRLTYLISHFLPCNCGTDMRLTATEDDDNWYAALSVISQFLDDLSGALPDLLAQSVEFPVYIFAGVSIKYEGGHLHCKVEESSVSSYGSAAELVTATYNAYVEEGKQENMNPVGDTSDCLERNEVETDRGGILQKAGRITYSEGYRSAISWLCFNKLSRGGKDSLSISGLNAELKRALLFMDCRGVQTLCGTPIQSLENARVPILQQALGSLQSALHFAGSVSGVPMIPEEKFLLRLSIRCKPRERLESVKIFTENEIEHTYKGRKRTIVVTKEGAVVAFFTRTKMIRNVLSGVRGITVLGNGASWDLSAFIGNGFMSDTELVNEALRWKYGRAVFHFILSKIMNGRILVRKGSPAASFVPLSSMSNVGVVLHSLLDNRLWREQTFILSRQNRQSRIELYWLPREGMNYFRVRRERDGLFTMVEVQSTVGKRLYRCAAIFPDQGCLR